MAELQALARGSVAIAEACRGGLRNLRNGKLRHKYEVLPSSPLPLLYLVVEMETPDFGLFGHCVGSSGT